MTVARKDLRCGSIPEYVGLGDDTEAYAYAAENISHWRRTSGARGWLEERSTKA